MRIRVVTVALTVALAAGIVACSSATTAEHFDLVEFAIAGPTQLDRDTETIPVANSGVFAHTLVITNPAGSVVAATKLLQPGESVDLEVALDPGAYSFTCRIVVETPDGTLVDHFEEGMAFTVEVTG